MKMAILAITGPHHLAVRIMAIQAARSVPMQLVTFRAGLHCMSPSSPVERRNRVGVAGTT